MLTAKDARLKTKLRQEEVYKNELKEIELAINNAINEGMYGCYMDNYWISAKAKTELEELGYKVEVRTFQDECSTKINWD